MSADPDSGAEPVHAQAGDGGTPHVDARQAVGVQVGQDNTQIIYNYSQLTWADGATLPPLASVSGKVDSPYRGLRAFEEQDAPFFFGREAVTADVLKRMSSVRGRDRDSWSCLGCRGRGSLRCCGPGYCRRSAAWGWRRRLGRCGGHACCSHRGPRLWTCWPYRWRIWRGSTQPRCGAGWTTIRPGLPSPQRQAALAQLGGRPGEPGSTPPGPPRDAAAVAGGRPVRAGVYPVP